MKGSVAWLRQRPRSRCADRRCGSSVANAGLISPVFFPGPDRSFGVLWEQLHEPEFWHRLRRNPAAHGARLRVGLAVGIAAGALIGMSQRCATMSNRHSN